jgi:hypothetical protein
MNVEENTERPENMRIPDQLKPFFWDVNCGEVSVRGSSRFIMSRLMEHGDELALRFLMRTFNREELRETLRTSRSISGRSRRFWAILLDMEVESCTVRRYPTPFGDCSWD